MTSRLFVLLLCLTGHCQILADGFVDKTRSAGIDFVHFNGMTGQLYYPEVMGSGAAMLDFDGDGDLDIYLVQGNLLGDQPVSQAIFKPQSDLRDHLYRNDTEEDGPLRFTDVTERSGIDARGYGMGVAIGDVNNDGNQDIYVTNFGANQLWLNQGDGTFDEVAKVWGVDDAAWSISASFVDLDFDGFSDLYVANYVSYDLDNPRVCKSETSVQDYCGPRVFKGAIDGLYRNLGGKGFQNISRGAGIATRGSGMGVVSTDINDDGQVDIIVSNDGMPNFLWISQGNGKFKEEALLAGVAVNREGMTEASMGVDAADFDNDGDEDVFMTHLSRETNTLYVNDGQGWFDERTAELRLANPSVRFTSFGSAWFDYNNDGQLDLLVVNGGVSFFESPPKTVRDPYPLHRVNQLFIQTDGHFEEARDLGNAFEASHVSRGAVFGDVDNDGDTDVLISNNSGPARLLINNKGQDNSWIGLIPLSENNLLVTNTRVSTRMGPKRVIYRRNKTDGSYASASDPRILLGLGGQKDKVTVTVQWPGGATEYWQGLAVNRYHEVRRGDGEKALLP